jgi:hypothetical protein
LYQRLRHIGREEITWLLPGELHLPHANKHPVGGIGFFEEDTVSV